jgi:hypothetical protein
MSSKKYDAVFTHRVLPADGSPTVTVGVVGTGHRKVVVHVPGPLADALKIHAPSARSTALVALADYALAELTRTGRRIVSAPLPRIDEPEQLPYHGRRGRPSSRSHKMH